MKTKDGRFVEKRVKLNKEKLAKAIHSYKEEMNWTWNKFAEYLGVSEHTLRHDWLKKGNTLPLSVYNRLLKLIPSLKEIEPEEIFTEFWGQKLNKKKKEIHFNLKEDKYAELYGAMLGDGCVFSNLVGICITCHSILDKNYLESYLVNIIKGLFNLDSNLYYSKKSKTLRCFVYSKNLSEWFIKEGFPVGKKLHNKLTIIPKKFFKKKESLKACIRGLVDTDGSLYPGSKSQPHLEISIYSKELLDSVFNAFKELGFKANKGKNKLYFYKQKDIETYFNLIGSSNYKNVLKYRIFLKTGKIPKSKEIETFLKKEDSYDIKLPYYGPIV